MLQSLVDYTGLLKDFAQITLHRSIARIELRGQAIGLQGAFDFAVLFINLTQFIVKKCRVWTDLKRLLMNRFVGLPILCLIPGQQ